jgi:hypothetical protein
MVASPDRLRIAEVGQSAVPLDRSCP